MFVTCLKLLITISTTLDANGIGDKITFYLFGILYTLTALHIHYRVFMHQKLVTMNRREFRTLAKYPIGILTYILVAHTIVLNEANVNAKDIIIDTLFSHHLLVQLFIH